MPRWLPSGFNQASVAQPHEDGIKRSGAETSLLRKIISMLPLSALRQESCKQFPSLG